MSMNNEVWVYKAVHPLELVQTEQAATQIRDAENNIVLRSGIELSNQELEYLYKVISFYEKARLLDGTKG